MILLQRGERIAFHASSIGEEAAIVGASLAAGPDDWVFPSARDWYATIARGLPLEAYVQHAFGTAADPTKGHAAPDHAPARKFGVVPPSGVAGAHLPQAVGAAWAAKIKRARGVATVALFDAGVCEGGDFHNAMNFAGVFKTPAVLVCRTGARPGGRVAARVAERAVAYGVASARVDGGDPEAVAEIVAAALARAREGRGATLIEVATDDGARLRDRELRLDGDGVLDLGEADPLPRARARAGVSVAEEASIAAEVNVALGRAIAAAEAAGPPARDTIFDHVYADIPRHLAAQRARANGERRG
jgi:pyruvate dehydrogenase E1 component alpha subunit/2-oxoisovalerate dehydrogenase E1 component alpha subunit